MTIETLREPEKTTIYRVYQWCEIMADWKGVAGFYDQAEALKAYAEKLSLSATYKLTKETSQDLLIKGE